MMRTDGYQRLAIVASVALSVTLGACAKDGAAKPAKTPSEGSAPRADSGDAGVLATIGGDKITMADVRARTGDQLDQLEGQYLRSRDKMIGGALDSIVHERLILAEAKKTGKSGEQLVVAEMAGGSTTPSDVEITAWYNDNQSRLGGRTLDQLRSQISDYLTKQRRAEAEKKLEQRLRDAAGVTIAYEPFRVRIANDGAPTLGPKDAPVTLVEFSDFQCPYCRSAAPILKQVAEKFGDKVQVVYRQYPISSIHPYAFKAAEASLCAHEQGKFWELHDLMFAEQQKLAVADLKEKARRLGMDGKKFDGCLDSGRYVEQVQKDEAEAKRVAANGTPSIYINGVYVEGGSVPFSTLEDLIQKELARGKPKS